MVLQFTRVHKDIPIISRAPFGILDYALARRLGTLHTVVSLSFQVANVYTSSVSHMNAR